MITSYEAMRKHAQDLAGVFDLMVGTTPRAFALAWRAAWTAAAAS